MHRVVGELIESKRLADATFAAAKTAFGEEGIVELGTIVGNALNAFAVPLPEGTALHFA